MLRHVFVIALLLGSIAPTFAAEDDAAILRRQTQELMDAVTHGDAKVWDRYVDPQVVYVDEEGNVTTKAELLPQIKPLPAGISGSIRAEVVDLHLFGDTAVLRTDDHESETYFGQALKAEYRSVTTWRRGSDGWKLIAAQVYAMLVDPPAIKLARARLDEYLGTYRLNSEITYMLRRDGDRLIGQRIGRDPVALAVEASDVLFVPGQPRSRKIFLRDDQGRVTGLADRRDGRDVHWTKEK